MLILTTVLMNRGSAVNVIHSVSNVHLCEWKGQGLKKKKKKINCSKPFMLICQKATVSSVGKTNGVETCQCAAHSTVLQSTMKAPTRIPFKPRLLEMLLYNERLLLRPAAVTEMTELQPAEFGRRVLRRIRPTTNPLSTSLAFLHTIGKQAILSSIPSTVRPRLLTQRSRVSRGYSEWCGKRKTSSEWKFCRRKRHVDERSPKRSATWWFEPTGRLL